MGTTVTGGLTKLISAFVKDTKQRGSAARIDLITSVDRDFGCSTWPGFQVMETMSPVPMFVGKDGIRRHAVGAGLAPLEDMEHDFINTVPTSTLLRSGLPASLLKGLHSLDDCQCPWRRTYDAGFVPVFDAGVERLMMVVDNDDSDMPVLDLWDQSTPKFVSTHYSENAGVATMLREIQKAKVQ